MDENLSWKNHVQKTCNKISSAIYIINKSKHFLPRQALKTLYDSLVHCHLNYGIYVWGGCTAVKTLVTVQKKAIRIINGKPYNYHTEPLFKENGILKMEDLYRMNSNIFMHQLKYNLLPDSFRNMTYFDKNTRLTRQSGLARFSRARTMYTSRLPRHTLPKLWNELDDNARDIATLSLFKRCIKKKYINSYKLNIQCNNNRCRQCFPTPGGN